MCYIRFNNSNSKLIKYQRGHMLYVYAIIKAIATTTLKLSQFGIDKSKAELEQWQSIRRR